MMAIENTMQYKEYTYLGGLISPIDGIGPNDIRVNELINRIHHANISEVIFALSSTMEGDTTNYYLYKKLNDYNIKISSISKELLLVMN